MLGPPSYTLVKTEDEEDTGKSYVPPNRRIGDWSSPISVTIVLVCAFVNVCLVVLLYSSTRLGFEGTGVNDADMKVNSTYIGLDRLYANTTAFKKYLPIRNQARRFFQISSRQPKRQLALEASKVPGPTGFIPSAHGFYQILVTSEVPKVLFYYSPY
ncbi:hypothetical protein CVT25_004996 [Psilocybe cyanescens]|uniref:Uncharacterized protein n=1 Tax=Psilocybe cyanescens TaxID=93625 RepID=A0A409X284_PSICY|nr:hypothetical protein CVT25_004996 [Psilocybe cyanescens]